MQEHHRRPQKGEGPHEEEKSTLAPIGNPLHRFMRTEAGRKEQGPILTAGSAHCFGAGADAGHVASGARGRERTTGGR